MTPDLRTPVPSRPALPLVCQGPAQQISPLTDLDDVIMTLLSLSPDLTPTTPSGVSPAPQPVSPHSPSASYLCPHMAVCSSPCCKRYSVFVLECVSTSVCVCVCVSKWKQQYDVNSRPRARDTHERLAKAKYFLRAYHTQLM